jgi:hypothetical protein
MNIFIGALVFVILPITLIIFIGIFFKKHALKNSKSTNLSDQLKEFKEQYPGWKGRSVLYGFWILFFSVLLLRAINSI